MRFRVNEGHQFQRGPATYGAGEEFDATGDEAQDLLKHPAVSRVDSPDAKKKPDED